MVEARTRSLSSKRVNRTAGARPFGKVSLLWHMLHSINSLEGPAACYPWRWANNDHYALRNKTIIWYEL